MTPTSGASRDDLELLERKHAENPEGRYFVPLANAYRRVGEPERAIELLRAGLEAHPDYLSAHVVLGRCLVDAGQEDAAADAFRHALSLDPQNLVALRGLGELALAAGRYEEGRAHYVRLLDEDPMNEEAREALATLPAEPSEDPRSSPPPAPADESFFDADDQPGEIAPAAPDDADDDHDELFGTMINLDEGPDPSMPAGSDAVVTETIAELYTRQGFYDRAAGVYRELIRRRGEEERLTQALARVERLAAGGEEEEASVGGGADGEPASGAGAAVEAADEKEAGAGFDAAGEAGEAELPAISGVDPLEASSGDGERVAWSPRDDPAEADDPDAAVPWAEDRPSAESSPGEGAPLVGYEPDEDWPPAGDAASVDLEDHDPFADSFADGFPMLDAPATEGVTQGAAPGDDRHEAPEQPQQMTIRELLRQVIAWSPGSSAPVDGGDETGWGVPPAAHDEVDELESAAAPGIEALAPGAGDEDTAVDAETGADELRDMPWAGDDARTGEARTESAHEAEGASDPEGRSDAEGEGADAVLFPWELPADDEQASAAAEDVPAGEASTIAEPTPAGPESEADDSRQDVASAPDIDASHPGPEADSDAEEASADAADDDLESFQEWLRSLRR